MSRFFAAWLCLSLAGSAAADMLDGTDDLAYRAAMATLLLTDDPKSVAVLRDLAEAGNPAALVALPLALQWVPPTGSLKEKNAQRMVGGENAQQAAAAVHEATALWNQGDVADTNGLLQRATGLQALGEHGKAALLLSNWLNQTGARLGVPPSPSHRT
jgi:hypothetical protein